MKKVDRVISEGLKSGYTLRLLFVRFLKGIGKWILFPIGAIILFLIAMVIAILLKRKD